MTDADIPTTPTEFAARRLSIDASGHSHTAHPVGHPIRSHSSSPLTTADTDLGSHNDGAHTGTTRRAPRPKQRMRPRDLSELQSWLSERDMAILQSVAEHQFLSVRHVEALHFADHAPTSGARIARRTLARLRSYRLLGTLQRRIGGVKAGSAGLIHYLDTVGDQLLSGRPGRRGRRRSVEPSSRFLGHRLTIADACVTLVEADRSRLIELVETTVEPATWRRYLGPGGARLTLKPDLFTETGADDDLVHAWFVEIDLGNETIPTLLKKCRAYEAYRRSGVEQDRSGGFPLVVWSVTHRNAVEAERRREALRHAIAADRSLLPQLFRVIPPQQLIPTLQQGGEQ